MLTKIQLKKVTKSGFSNKKNYLNPFRCKNNTIREYYKNKRAEIISGVAR